HYIVLLESLPEGDFLPSMHHANIIKEIVDPREIPTTKLQKKLQGFAAYVTEAEMQKLKSYYVCCKPLKLLPKLRCRDFSAKLLVVKNRMFHKAKKKYLLVAREVALPLHSPFHFKGMGPNPSSLKLGDSGHIPLSITPIVMPPATPGFLAIPSDNWMKIIGARYYSIDDLSSISARDRTGHGTHVASIVAGNYVKGASFYGIADGVAKGGVTSARLAVYKVCDIVCHTTDLLSAFDDAIADGVVVLSVSISLDQELDFTIDPIAIGSLHVVRRNILTSVSAGNEGPVLGSIQNFAPWMLTAGASDNDRRIIDKVLLGKELILVGQGVNAFPSSYRESPLVLGKEVTSTCSETDARCKIVSRKSCTSVVYITIV
nr:subtilisin-like protease SBT4.3 [Tanacetum cinerariifolium]